jgi:hypothetical protein
VAAAVPGEEPMLVEMIAGKEFVVRIDEVAEIAAPVVPSATEEVVDMAHKPNLVIPCK